MLLADMIGKFNQRANEHLEKQSLNPFSGGFTNRSPSPRLGQDDYGRPVAGSKTELRGQKAKSQINKEILELCNCIYDVGTYNTEQRKKEEDYDPEEDDGTVFVAFGELFQIYTKINNKLNGLLIAAKKRGFVYFEKEILFQRRDDDVLIALVKPIQEIRATMREALTPSPMPMLSRTPSPGGCSSRGEESPCPLEGECKVSENNNEESGDDNKFVPIKDSEIDTVTDNRPKEYNDQPRAGDAIEINIECLENEDDSLDNSVSEPIIIISSEDVQDCKESPPEDSPIENIVIEESNSEQAFQSENREELDNATSTKEDLPLQTNNEIQSDINTESSEQIEAETGIPNENLKNLMEEKSENEILLNSECINNKNSEENSNN